MATYRLDGVEEQLIGYLQENARHTALELAERIGVSDNTIHNRMEKLEEAGVVTGYTATVDNEKIGLDRYFTFTCTTRISKRAELADEVLAIPEVVEVTELMTGERNLLVKAVGATDEDISRIAEQVDELDIEINDENLIRAEHTKSLDYSEIDTRPETDR